MPPTVPVVIDHNAAPTGRPPGSRTTLALAGAGSLAVTVLCLVLLAVPGINPINSENGVLGTLLMPATALTILLAAVGGVGAVCAAARLRSERARASRTSAATSRTWVAASAVVGLGTAVAFGVLAQGTGTLSTFGYLVAIAVPVVLVTLWVLAFRAYSGGARVILVVVAAAAAVGIVTAREALGGYFMNLARLLPGELWSIASVVLPLLAAVAWAAVLVRDARADGRGRRITAWVTRHRVLFTVLAALGPLPYSIIRLTWLTPWPQFGGPIASADPAIRVQGLMLGAAGWLGFVLTLGLIARWGERLPRWFPGGTGDRPVHPLAAIIPGGLVALMLCGAAIPMLLLMGWHGALLFPAWFWGPTLALAVWGYAGHRYGVTDRGEPSA